jgi:hypothetical protein
MVGLQVDLSSIVEMVTIMYVGFDFTFRFDFTQPPLE